MKKSIVLNDQTLLKNLCYIDGKWVAAKSGNTFSVTNPVDNSEITTVPDMDDEDTKVAIAAAHLAQREWRKLSGKERSFILRGWFDLIVANCNDLALILTSEQGKPLAEAKGEILYAASFIEWFAEEGKRIYGDVIPAPSNDKRIIVIKQPIGVCAAITPWNFPSAMITRKVAPALAVGCTMIIKPAGLTPLSALALCELASRAGIPAGVINVVVGNHQNSRKIGAEMTNNPVVRKLSFTGSTEVGRTLLQQCAAGIKKVSLELGGNAPFIVFADADIDAAVEGAMNSKYRNSGQTCVCANRIIVHADVYQEFSQKLAKRVLILKVGSGVENGVNQGPLINQAALEKIEEHIADALAKGAKVIAGGARHQLAGTFFQPTILTDVTDKMLCASEETFGPLAPIFKFTTDDEAIALANNTDFGLASYFYSRDINRIWKVAEELEAGMVGVNTGLISNEVSPFGGVKQSGLGREGSKYGSDDYLQIKQICMGGL